MSEEVRFEIDWHVATDRLTGEDREAIVSRLPRLARAVRDLPGRVLHIEVDHNPRKGGFGVALHLALLHRSLYAAEWARDPGLAGRRALRKMASQVATYRAHLRRFEKRAAREGPPVPAEEIAADRRRAAAAALERVRPAVARLVRHEIVHDPSLADLPKEAISVPDVVDEAMVWTLEHLDRRPAYLTPDQFLWRRTLHQLDLARASVLRRRDGEAAQGRADAAHAERPQDLDMEWEDARDLLFGGGEPLPLDLDEAPATASDPGSMIDREALQMGVSEALRELPEAQRRAVMLHDLEGYAPEEIAFVLHRSEDQVRHDLDVAHRTLRQRLRGWAE